MRPRKVVLCVDGNEQELSVRRFLLEIWGYRVVEARSGARALRLLAEMAPGTVDAMVCDLHVSDMDSNEVVRRAKRLHPGLSTMITSRVVQEYPVMLLADLFLPRAANTPREVRERVRNLVARRRGPKKNREEGVGKREEKATCFEAREQAA
jgi:CheY-like chemotaxis protein